jgi:tetratricopeptide (TPR) repeat protein
VTLQAAIPLALKATVLLNVFAIAQAAAAAPNTSYVPEATDSVFVAAMRQGDDAFAEFKNDSALVFYQRAFAIDSTDCVLLWKLAHANVNHGMSVPDDERRRFFSAGEALARRSVASCPDSTEGHFFLAVAIGQMTKVVGNKQRIELSKEIQREAETALSLDPDHAGAMHVLGRWNYEIASLGWFSKMAAKVVYGGVPPGASYEEAKAWFERAIAVRPEMPLNHFWLAEALIKLDDYARARQELQACLALDDVLWDDSRTKKKAEKRLRDIEGKK